ncbi:substrate binding domain-containing protein [Plesiocystis pacifica]|uniref:substrate binding domain-containing protein n=1 Tax=Plesiocystis pacifica TaxID=191768 RepID=UPI0012FB435D|nr:substrate binding domain-containing protein [Plesiocystis pacifica]
MSRPLGPKPPGSTAQSSKVARWLGRVARVLVASPDYLDAFGRPEQPADLAEHEAIVTLTARGPDHLWRLTRGEREYTVGVRGRLRSTTLLANFRGALAGLGIALVPRWLAREALADERLELVLPHFEAPTIDLFAVYRARDRGSPVLTALVTSMRRALSR